MQALAERGMAPSALAYVDSQGRPIWGVAIQLAFGLLAFIGESNQEGMVFNWLLALSGLSFFFIWAAICLAHIRFRHAWKVQGHVKAELPFEAMFGVGGSWYGLILNILCMIATFYVALFVRLPTYLLPLTFVPAPNYPPPLQIRELTLPPASRRVSKCLSLLSILPRGTHRHRAIFWLEDLRSELGTLDFCCRYGHPFWTEEY